MARAIVIYENVSAPEEKLWTTRFHWLRPCRRAITSKGMKMLQSH